MEIKILGTGCPKCKTLEKLTREVVENNNLDATITKEEDIMKIMEYGVMQTPGVVVDGKVVLSGRLPSSSELLNLLTIK
ncbi:MAG: thioredoxin family protein [Bacteroidales bacterium]|jgi:small redox-active disulfide protein 2|nr:thioredoxin family protein [Bacteroidales bacterium]